jgi:hypothetical protein
VGTVSLDFRIILCLQVLAPSTPSNNVEKESLKPNQTEISFTFSLQQEKPCRLQMLEWDDASLFSNFGP